MQHCSDQHREGYKIEGTEYKTKTRKECKKDAGEGLHYTGDSAYEMTDMTVPCWSIINVDAEKLESGALVYFYATKMNAKGWSAWYLLFWESG